MEIGGWIVFGPGGRVPDLPLAQERARPTPLRCYLSGASPCGGRSSTPTGVPTCTTTRSGPAALGSDPVHHPEQTGVRVGRLWLVLCRRIRSCADPVPTVPASLFRSELHCCPGDHRVRPFILWNFVTGDGVSYVTNWFQYLESIGPTIHTDKADCSSSIKASRCPSSPLPWSPARPARCGRAQLVRASTGRARRHHDLRAAGTPDRRVDRRNERPLRGVPNTPVGNCPHPVLPDNPWIPDP